MIPSTKRAAHKLNPEPHSWSKHGIERRAYRQMPLLPEEECLRPRRKKKPKHIHKWSSWEFQRSTTWYSWWRKTKVETQYYIRSCKKCGHKDQRITESYGHHHRIPRD